MSDVRTKVIGIFARQHEVPETRITDDTSTNDLGGDSLDLLEFTFSLEEAFGYEISDGDANAWENIGDTITYMEKRTGNL